MKLRLLWVALGTLFAFAVSANTGCAQQPAPASGDLQKQIDTMRAQVNAMQKDLDEIKALLAPLRAQRQPTPPPNARLDLGNRPVRGLPAAKVTLVELTDYQ